MCASDASVTPGDPEPASSSRASRVLRLLMRLTGVVLLAVLLTTIDWEDARAILGRADRTLLLLVGGLNLVFILAKAGRWFLLLRQLGIDARLGWEFHRAGDVSQLSMTRHGGSTSPEDVWAAVNRLEKDNQSWTFEGPDSRQIAGRPATMIRSDG